MKYIKIKYRLLVYLTSLLFFFLGILKKALKKSSENDQLTGHFQSFFYLFYFVPPTLNLKKNPVNQLIKKSGLTFGHFAEIKMASKMASKKRNNSSNGAF